MEYPLKLKPTWSSKISSNKGLGSYTNQTSTKLILVCHDQSKLFGSKNAWSKVKTHQNQPDCFWADTSLVA